MPTTPQNAVRHFWKHRDAGTQSGVHMAEFVNLIRDVFAEAGVSAADVHYEESGISLPGYFRATKKWDLIVVVGGKLAAAIELKSQFGSVGKNQNNRTEEAIGSGVDLWKAYQNGYFGDPSVVPPPFIGYLMVLGKEEKMMSLVGPVPMKHFAMAKEFNGLTRVQRYEKLVNRLVSDANYSAGCILLTPPTAVRDGKFEEPAADLTWAKFSQTLSSKARQFAALQGTVQSTLVPRVRSLTPK